MRAPLHLSGPVRNRFNRLPRALRIAAAALLGLSGGAFAAEAAAPIPWLIGSLGAAAAISLVGFDIRLPDQLRKLGQLAAGFAVGLFFTPEVGFQVVSLGWLMILTAIVSIFASVGISALLVKYGSCDQRTAFFAMIPGGLAEMAGLAQQFGANITLVSLSQSLRVVIIVVTLPPLLVFSIGQPTGAAVAHAQMSYGVTLAGLAGAALLSLALQHFRIFNAWLLGGLFAGVAFGVAPEVHLFAPDELGIFAQVAIGTALGARFQAPVLRAAGRRFVPATILATTLLILINLIMAGLIASQIDLPTGILATAPGGIAEMSLTAEALNLAPPLVTAWQLVRIVLVALATAPIFRLYQKMFLKESQEQ